MLTCTRIMNFDAAHRVVGHKGKCAKLHGHRYIVEATFIADALSDLGMIIDFSLIKQKVGKWIDDNLDHNTILCKEDSNLGQSIESLLNQKIYYMKNNPTAENIASHLLLDILPNLLADIGVTCVKIRLYETPNCYAEASTTSL